MTAEETVAGEAGRHFKPIHGMILVALVMAGFLAASWAIQARHGRAGLQRIAPDAEGRVRIGVADLGTEQARFYRFLNAANQEVELFVARDRTGTLQVAFNAGESHYKLHRGFSIEDGWVVDNKCETTTYLTEVNSGGSGCKPVPLRHRVEGEELVLEERDILAGWRYFR